MPLIVDMPLIAWQNFDKVLKFLDSMQCDYVLTGEVNQKKGK